MHYHSLNIYDAPSLPTEVSSQEHYARVLLVLVKNILDKFITLTNFLNTCDFCKMILERKK